MLRLNWIAGFQPVQWNVVTSEAGALRGMHVHVRHTDFVVLVEGRATIGLRDLRGSASGVGNTLDVDGTEPVGVLIPPGVAHGFYYDEWSVQMYCVSQYWDQTDERGCHWQDPALQIAWPVDRASVSKRDASAGSLAELLAELEQYQPIP
jgi:dTDP-4-dehydrorhamnose 3,5-epimerase